MHTKPIEAYSVGEVSRLVIRLQNSKVYHTFVYMKATYRVRLIIRNIPVCLLIRRLATTSDILPVSENDLFFRFSLKLVLV